LRIARDLHDSVAHAMATINVQSGVAAHLLDRKPEQAKVALEAIRRASSDVLDELGTILGALRRDDGAAPRAPAAGLDRLDDLVERSSADGVAVTCTVAGDPAVLPPSLSAAAYRVIQEALSNTRRHAGDAATATVAVTIDGPGVVSVDVADDGGRRRGAPQAPATPGHGFGLAGMRERVESTGGVLTTGPRPIPDRGFRVRASWGTR
jgi:signal transduction histidine kinase